MILLTRMTSSPLTCAATSTGTPAAANATGELLARRQIAAAARGWKPRPTSIAEVNAAFAKAAKGPLGKYLEYSELPLVSVDLCGNPHSAIFDAPLTAVVNQTQVKVFAWYDNEWGYSNRIIDLIELIGSKL